MIFQNPLGLIALVGIPVLIIIYIIKSKYTEQTVPSTYIWTLSEKFIKRRNPLSKLAGIISLILQILSVIAIALVIARPVFILPGEASEYCFIIDGSGSMTMEEDGKSRFDVGKEKIAEIIDSSKKGSRYTLVTVGAETSVIYESLDNKAQAISMLSYVTPSHSDVDYADAIGTAQAMFNSDHSLKTYLVTDTSYESTPNITVINVGTDSENISLSDLTYADYGESVTVFGKLTSYKGDKEIALSVYVDGRESSVATKTLFVTESNDLSPYTEFDIDVPVADFYSLEVRVDGKDAYSLDSTYVIYNVKSVNSYKTLLVTSSESIYLPYILEKVTSADVTKVKPSEYKPGGYGLYIFDSCVPSTVPTDGAVWFINSMGTSEGSGFAYQREVTLDTGELMEKTSSAESLVTTLMDGVYGTDLYITKYIRYGLYDRFTSLFTYKGDPIIFTGANEHGNREVVFAFDLSTSNFALTTDFGVLVKNLLDYSFPPVLERTNYKSGETARINPPSGCELIRVDTPLGNVQFLDSSSVFSEFLLSESGVYTITVTLENSTETYSIFAETPVSEREPLPIGEGIIGLQGDAVASGVDGIYDDLTVFFVILAVLLVADWMVYCYEKYQLR